MSNIYLSGFNLNDLLEKIGEVIESKLSQVAPHNNVQDQTKFLSRHEVAKLLKISLPTLNEWSKLGWLQSYKIGNRVLYKQNEIEEALHKVLNMKYKKI
jgi:excisionase family DNA binding protein